jgi:hypothetical protein
MVVLHAFIALAAGFATTALLVAIATALLRKLTPDWAASTGGPKPGYIFVNLGYSFVASAAGGFVTAWIAEHNAIVHVLALPIIVLLLGALSALQQRGKQPVWYLLFLVAITPIGAFIGGLVRLRMLGVL